MNWSEKTRLLDIWGLFEFSHYFPPKSVGTAWVKEVTEGDSPDYETIVLDLPVRDEEDGSANIRQVPKGWFHEIRCAEIIVRKYFGPNLDVWKNTMLTKGSIVHLPTHCRVAIRPFKPQTYGKSISVFDPRLNEMFSLNVKRAKYCQAFYKKFMDME